MHTVVVSGGRDNGKENMSGIGRLHCIKSRKSCLMKGKPSVYIYTFHSLRYGARMYLLLRSLHLALKMTQAQEPAPIVNKV